MSSIINVPALIFVICFRLTCCCLGAETAPTPDTDRLAHWIAGQQCLTPGLSSYGALKQGSAPAATGPDGKPYCCINPYFADLGILGLLQARTPDCTRVANRWIGWYLSHLTPQSAPEGVPCDHFCRSDGEGETNCIKPSDPLLCRHTDATDSAAATFFSVLWAAHQAGLPDSALASPDQKQRVETLAAVLLKLQQSDGLCWAKAGYRVKFLEDNSEVFAGLRDLADLERDVFHDSNHASLYRQAAERVQRGIFRELRDPQARLFFVAQFENDQRTPTNLDQWYPDTQAQLWPLLFGVADAQDFTTRAAIAAVNQHWNGRLKPDWASAPGQVNEGWLEAGDACAMLLGGETQKVRTFFHAAKQLKFRNSDDFAAPWTIADAGWLLQISVRLAASGNAP
jgi:hypothetical protein